MQVFFIFVLQYLHYILYILCYPADTLSNREENDTMQAAAELSDSATENMVYTH